MRRPRFTGLRVRLAATFAAVALLASVLASGISYVLLRDAMLQRAQDLVLAEVRQTLTRLVPLQLPREVQGELRDDLVRALSVSGRKAVTVPVSADGPGPVPRQDVLDVPVSRAFAAGAWNGMVFQRSIRDGKPFLLVGARVTGHPLTPADLGSTLPPVVFVTASLEKEAADLRSFTSAVVVADSLAVAAALVLALPATRGVLRPVRRLGKAARALGAGELDTRIRVRGRDELADLARTFNGTAGAMERTVTELRALEAASRRFVADVSHELRTPLTSMIAATDLLAEEAAPGEGGVAARLVAAETRRLGALVEHLIEISRFDAGAAALVPDDVEVAAAVAATLAARGWTDRVAVDGPADLVAGLDPRRFDVIVANLAGNALKHGRPPVRVEFGAADRNGVRGFLLTVADHGPGVPADLRAVVFDRFVKADTARSRSEGSGLGLSIARENAVLHAGTLEAGAAPGGGALFTLWLPIGPEEAG